MVLDSLIVDGVLEEAIFEESRKFERVKESLNFKMKVKSYDKIMEINRYSIGMFSSQVVPFRNIGFGEKVEGSSKI